jgi:hypothetical protein
MNKYSLLQSIQAGPFSNSNRMIDLEIPENIQSNPSQSFIQLMCHLNVTQDVSGASPASVFNFVVKNTTTDLTPMNVDLIRNCYMTGEKCGKIEDLRRVNVLKHNLLELSMSSSEKMAQVNTLYQMNDFENHELLSPFIEYHKEGTIPSQYVDARLRIPLSHLFESAQLQLIDTSKTGKLRLHLELEDLTYLTVTKQSLLSRFSGEGAMDVLSQGGNVITTTSLFTSVSKSPYYVGQPLLLAYTPFQNTVAGTPVTDVNITITGINYDVTTKKIALTISPMIPNLVSPNNQYKNIVVKDLTAGPTATLAIETAELGLCQTVGPAPSQGMLEYFTWTTEEYSTGGTSKMNKIFEIEPNCVNVVMMFNNSTSNLISNNTKVKSYRMRIDNVDVYDRDILVNKENTLEKNIHDSLHYDSINRTFMNMGKSLKNLNFVNMAQTQQSFTNRFNQPALQIMLLAAPTPVTAGTKKLQINVEATENFDNVILYKQIAKGIKL